MEKTVSFDYFDSFERQTLYVKEMTLNLVSALHAGELGTYELMSMLHVVENDADQVNHEIQHHLRDDFTVPLERSGMGSLAHALDDVCDAVEQIAIDAYTRKFEQAERGLPNGFLEIVAFLEAGCENLSSAVSLMRSCEKNRREIARFTVEVQTCESKADEVYIMSLRSLYEDESLAGEPRRIAQDLLDAAESAMDAMENAAERIETLVAESV